MLHSAPSACICSSTDLATCSPRIKLSVNVLLSCIGPFAVTILREHRISLLVASSYVSDSPVRIPRFVLPLEQLAISTQQARYDVFWLSCSVDSRHVTLVWTRVSPLSRALDVASSDSPMMCRYPSTREFAWT